MDEQLILIKLILAHLLTDFVLQPASWVAERRLLHFRSPKLYLHGLLTAVVAWALIGWQHWMVMLVILVTHTVIDGFKSFTKDRARWFLLDQALHLLILAGCWWFVFAHQPDVVLRWNKLTEDPVFWKYVTAFVFVSFPAGIIIGQLTNKWREKVLDPDNSLAQAGKWIGIAERIIVLILVLQGQFSAIGLLVAAKGIIRFSEKDRQEIKTEYLVVGTLLSIGVAIVTGLMIR